MSFAYAADEPAGWEPEGWLDGLLADWPLDWPIPDGPEGPYPSSFRIEHPEWDLVVTGPATIEVGEKVTISVTGTPTEFNSVDNPHIVLKFPGAYVRVLDGSDNPTTDWLQKIVTQTAWAGVEDTTALRLQFGKFDGGAQDQSLDIQAWTLFDSTVNVASLSTAATHTYAATALVLTGATYRGVSIDTSQVVSDWQNINSKFNTGGLTGEWEARVERFDGRESMIGFNILPIGTGGGATQLAYLQYKKKTVYNFIYKDYHDTYTSTRRLIVAEMTAPDVDSSAVYSVEGAFSGTGDSSDWTSAAGRVYSAAPVNVYDATSATTWGNAISTANLLGTVTVPVGGALTTGTFDIETDIIDNAAANGADKMRFLFSIPGGTYQDDNTADALFEERPTSEVASAVVSITIR